MAKIKVDLKERSYDIVIGTDNLKDLGETVRAENLGKDIFIITDPLVNDLYGDTLRKSFSALNHHTIEVPRGERYKSLRTASFIYDELVKCSAHRDSLIVALGGGVIADLAGFAAATFMRGISYVQVPTTLLAQVDASIGGKTGVNHPKGKNLIGSFFQPRLVFIDVKTLTTLPARELKTGLAEVVKYGVIKDGEFFKFLEANAHHLNAKPFEAEDTLRASLPLWQTIVFESAKIKARVVEKDEREGGPRMVLNFGHTIGHALETLTKYRAYNHGEAVSVGMVAAASIAVKLRLFDRESARRLQLLLEKIGLPAEIEKVPADKIINALNVDKKVREGKVLFVLPERIGRVLVKGNVPVRVIKEALKELGAR